MSDDAAGRDRRGDGWPSPERLLTDEEVAACHEAAHAVLAVLSNWLRLRGPVRLANAGHGDASIGMQSEKVQAGVRGDTLPYDEVRREQIRCLLAGAAAERRLIQLGVARLGEAEIRRAAQADYEQVDRERRKLEIGIDLGSLEQDAATAVSAEVQWQIITRFAAQLAARKVIPEGEAGEIIRALAKELDPSKASEEGAEGSSGNSASPPERGLHADYARVGATSSARPPEPSRAQTRSGGDPALAEPAAAEPGRGDLEPGSRERRVVGGNSADAPVDAPRDLPERDERTRATAGRPAFDGSGAAAPAEGCITSFMARLRRFFGR